MSCLNYYRGVLPIFYVYRAFVGDSCDVILYTTFLKYEGDYRRLFASLRFHLTNELLLLGNQ